MKIITILSVSFLAFAFAGSASAAVSPNWDITGAWELDYHYINGANWHDWFTTTFDCETGAITGNGGYPLDGPPYSYAWTITSGSVNGDIVEFYADYTSGVVCSFHILGTIAGDGLSMSGTWDDNCFGNRVGTFTATGVATPADCDQDGSPNNLDCNDSDATIYPGAEDSACNGVDNDCDLAVDEDYVNTPTQCGIGECAAFGEMTCVAGSEVDTCAAGTPVAEICDGLDNDCDAATDEDLTVPDADKQYGVCEGSLKVCTGVGGWIEPDYSLIADYENPEVSCDTFDNDCDGTTDQHVCNWYCGTTQADTGFKLGTNRWIWESGSIFKTVNPDKKTVWTKSYTLAQTNNCSCSQILDQLHEYNPVLYNDMTGHWKYGCSISVMNEFINLINPIYHPLTGTWLLSVNNGVYKHDMFITVQDVNGDLTGTGGYISTTVNPLPYEITWVLENSSVIGNTVDLTLNYDSSSYTAHIWGTVASDWNSMSGGAGTGGVVNWLATRI